MTKSDDDQLAQFLFIPKEEEKKPIAQTLIVAINKKEDSESIDLFSLMTRETKPSKQLNKQIENKESSDTEQVKQLANSTSIVAVPNIPVIDSAIVEPANSIENNNSVIAESAIANSKEVHAIGNKERTPRLHYAHGKATCVMEQAEVEARYSKAYLTLQEAAYFVCLDDTGARKMELANMRVNQFKLTDQGIELSIVRSKHSAQTLPILLRKEWWLVDKLIAWYLQRVNAKPSTKLIEKVYTTKGALIGEQDVIVNGVVATKKIYAKGVKHVDKNYVKDLWMFPNVARCKALKIAKDIYGSDKYAHYGRAKRLTLLLANPKASVTLAKSFSGIKSTRVIETYMMVSKKQLDLANDLLDADIQKKQTSISP